LTNLSDKKFNHIPYNGKKQKLLPSRRRNKNSIFTAGGDLVALDASRLWIFREKNHSSLGEESIQKRDLSFDLQVIEKNST
jgi:hypothetical protein